jgi:hypothetical protein
VCIACRPTPGNFFATSIYFQGDKLIGPQAEKYLTPIDLSIN